MSRHISAIQNEDDRERALERVSELSGCLEQSPEEVELILLTLTLELWELRQRTAAMPDALEFPKPRGSNTRRPPVQHPSIIETR